MEKKNRIFSSISRAERKSSLFIFFLFLAINTSFGQSSWSVEVRPGVNFATKDLGNASLKTGFGIEGTLNYRFLSNLVAYAGWGWNKFSANQSFAGQKNDFEETGYTLGLQYIHSTENSMLGYFVEAGAILSHIEVKNSEGRHVGDSEHGPGWQAGIGLSVLFGERFRVIPAVRYRALSRDIKIGEIKTPVDLNYVTGGVGLSWTF